MVFSEVAYNDSGKPILIQNALVLSYSVLVHGSNTIELGTGNKLNNLITKEMKSWLN